MNHAQWCRHLAALPGEKTGETMLDPRHAECVTPVEECRSKSAVQTRKIIEASRASW